MKNYNITFAYTLNFQSKIEGDKSFFLNRTFENKCYEISTKSNEVLNTVEFFNSTFIDLYFKLTLSNLTEIYKILNIMYFLKLNY